MTSASQANAIDYAHVLKDLADIHFPDKKTIVLVAKRTPLVVATNLIAAAIGKVGTVEVNTEQEAIEEVVKLFRLQPHRLWRMRPPVSAVAVSPAPAVRTRNTPPQHP